MVRSSYKIKNLDMVFILFIILVLQGDIALKIIGILFVLLLRSNAILKIKGFSWFYLFMLIFHLFYGVFNLFWIGTDYLPTFILVSIFWILSWVINAQLVFFFDRSNIITQTKSLNILFVVFVVFVVYQYLALSLKLETINPYGANQAAGDYMHSIFANSSVSMLVFSFFFFLYFQQKKWKWCFFALACLLMAAYMSGTILFLAASIFSILIFSKVKLSYKLYFIMLTGIFISLLVVTSPENIKYASGYIERIMENDQSNMPFKIKSFWQTIEYWFSSIGSFIVGSGGGNFSSRAAFIISGDYVEWFPKAWVYVSEEFSKNHFGIWTHDFNNPWDNRNNTANQPFSFYNKIIGEYGLIGLLGFCVLYLGYVIKVWKKLSYSKYMVIALAGYFLLDYWFEYFAIMVVFELLVIYDLNQSREANKIKG